MIRTWEDARESFYERNFRHHPFCSALSPWPCRCWSWARCAKDFFPNMPDACPAICPDHGPRRAHG